MRIPRWWVPGGVENPLKYGTKDSADRRHFVYTTIDRGSLQKWVIFVAGIGFLTDAYDIFALNVVLPMLGYVYWDGNIPHSYNTALTCTSLAGTVIGQAVFGVLGDLYGRRKMYGLQLVVVMAATLGVAMSATGAADSMAIIGWLIFWRFTMGVAIGADYPLSAVITAEFAPRKWRARMLAMVFWMQPVGQLLAMVVSLVAQEAVRRDLPSDATTCTTAACTRAIDRMWRAVVGSGAVPALIAVAFRFTIPESPRYTLDISGETDTAYKDTRDYFGTEEHMASAELLENGPGIGLRHRGTAHSDAGSFQEKATADPIITPMTPASLMGLGSTANHQRSPSYGLAVSGDQRTLAESPVMHGAMTAPRSHSPPLPPSRPASLRSARFHDDDDITATNTQPHYDNHGDDDDEEDDERANNDRHPGWKAPPQRSWEDAREFFWVEGNWRHLLGTALAWFLLDFAFYGLGLSSKQIVTQIWYANPAQQSHSVWQSLLDNTTHELVVVSIGSVVGGLAFVKVIRYASPKTFQKWGFLVLAALFLITGSVFTQLLGPGLVVLYVLCELVFNLGPNPTTYIIPAEIFPTRYRCSCHGVSAAAGKLGSVIAQLFLAYVSFDGQSYTTSATTWLGHILQVFCAFMAAGALVTWIYVPETRDAKGASRSLEVLAGGRRRLLELGGRTAPEDGGEDE